MLVRIERNETAQPTCPGWHEFKGIRTTPTGKWMVSVEDVVKVVRGSKAGTYRVQTAGSSLQYSSEMYEGTWQFLGLEST